MDRRLSLLVLASVIVLVLTVGGLSVLGVFNPDGDGSQTETAIQWSTPINSVEHADNISRYTRMSRTDSGGYKSFPQRTQNFGSTTSFATVDYYIDGAIRDKREVASFVLNATENRFENVTGSASTPTTIHLYDYRKAAETLQLLNESGLSVQTGVDISNFSTGSGKYCKTIYRSNNSCVSPSGSTSAVVSASLAATKSDVSAASKELIRNELRSIDSVNASSLEDVYYPLRAAERLAINTSTERVREAVGENQTRIADEILAENATMNSAFYYQQILSYLGVDSSSFNREYISKLKEIDNRHGGYHVLYQNYSEPQGTALTLKFINQTEQRVGSVVNTTKVNRFVKMYSNHDGSYSEVVQSEPKIEHTYYALSILKMVEREPQHVNKTTQWLRNRVSHVGYENLSLRQIHRLHLLERELEVDVVNDEYTMERIGQAFERDLRGTSARELYYITRVADLLGEDIDESAIKNRITAGQHGNGTFGKPPRTDTTYYSVMTLHHSGESVRESGTIREWISESGAESGGYRFREGNEKAPVPDIWTTYTSTKLLDVLDKDIPETDVLKRWVRGLHTRNGGFAAAPIEASPATPQMRSTYISLKLIRLVESAG